MQADPTAWGCEDLWSGDVRGTAFADAILTGGNGFRAVGAIESLEQDLRRPVLTANSVTFWNALRAAGVFAPVTHYGRMFAEPLPAD